MHALTVDPQASETLTVADLVIDCAHQRALRGHRRLRLTPRELGVLVVLARNAGRVVSRETLYRAVWGEGEIPASNLIDATISHLRAKVDWGHRLRLIHTARGAGYVLEPHADAPGPRLVQGD